VAQAFGRFTYGVLLPAIRDDLAISNTVAGSLGTVNVGAYLFGTIVVAAATSRYRLLDVMRVGFLFSTAGLTLSAFAPGVWVLGVAMFASGLGGAMIWIPAPVIAADAIAPERRSLAIGLMGSGIGLGIVFSSQLSAYVRSSLGDDSWRTVYAVQAVIAVVVVLATLLFIGHSQVKPAGQRSGVGGFQVLRKMHGWAALTLAYASFGLMYLLVVAFLTTRLEDDSKWTGARASLAFTSLGIAVIFGGPLFITLAKRTGPRPAMALAFTLWSVAAIAILPGWFGSTLAASVVLGLLFAGIPGLITLYVVENTTVDDFGPSFAAATLSFGVAQMMSPQIGGRIADITGSFTLVFVLSSGFALIGTAAALRLPRRV
jgi:predicted MFS family arabinose efflux permease